MQYETGTERLPLLKAASKDLSKNIENIEQTERIRFLMEIFEIIETLKVHSITIEIFTGNCLKMNSLESLLGDS